MNSKAPRDMLRATLKFEELILPGYTG